jgi:hypothetical protein
MGIGSGLAERRGLTKAMDRKIAATPGGVKYFVLQSMVRVQSAALASEGSERGYRPNSEFHRIMKTSRNICTLSRNILTFVAGECAQRTGISAERSP